jgi:hypothetical protein
MSVALPNKDWTIGSNKFVFSKDVLTRALKRIFDSVVARNICPFFLIDGLDEFDDREQRHSQSSQETILTDLLRHFRKRPTIKLCVSSRPYIAFKSEFMNADCTWIPLHELTQDNICTFVKETMFRNDAFRKLAAED